MGHEFLGCNEFNSGHNTNLCAFLQYILSNLPYVEYFDVLIARIL